MASDTFKTLLFGLILFVGFTYLLITVAVDFGAEYGVNSSSIGDGALDGTAYETTVQNVSNTAEGYRTSFESGDVDDVDDPSGIFSIATNMISLIVTPFTLLSQVLTNILHIPTFIINIVLGLLSIALIFGIWRVLRTGD